jgi:hypothetical protein
LLHARCTYKGETKRCLGDRIALLTCNLSEETKLLKVLTLINGEYPPYKFGHLSEDGEVVEYYVQVIDKEDFQAFLEVWKKFKKKV